MALAKKKTSDSTGKSAQEMADKAADYLPGEPLQKTQSTIKINRERNRCYLKVDQGYEWDDVNMRCVKR